MIDWIVPRILAPSKLVLDLVGLAMRSTPRGAHRSNSSWRTEVSLVHLLSVVRFGFASCTRPLPVGFGSAIYILPAFVRAAKN